MRKLSFEEAFSPDYQKPVFDISSLIEEYSKEFGIPSELIQSQAKFESGTDPTVISDAGAIGVMQIMPETAKGIAAELGEEYSKNKLFDPDTNIRWGVYHMKTLIDKYEGDREKALAAYLAGEGTVNKVLGRGGSLDEIIDPYTGTSAKQYASGILKGAGIKPKELRTLSFEEAFRLKEEKLPEEILPEEKPVEPVEKYLPEVEPMSAETTGVSPEFAEVEAEKPKGDITTPFKAGISSVIGAVKDFYELNKFASQQALKKGKYYEDPIESKEYTEFMYGSPERKKEYIQKKQEEQKKLLQWHEKTSDKIIAAMEKTLPKGWEEEIRLAAGGTLNPFKDPSEAMLSWATNIANQTRFFVSHLAGTPVAVTVAFSSVGKEFLDQAKSSGFTDDEIDKYLQEAEIIAGSLEYVGELALLGVGKKFPGIKKLSKPLKQFLGKNVLSKIAPIIGLGTFEGLTEWTQQGIMNYYFGKMAKEKGWDENDIKKHFKNENIFKSRDFWIGFGTGGLLSGTLTAIEIAQRGTAPIEKIKPAIPEGFEVTPEGAMVRKGVPEKIVETAKKEIITPAGEKVIAPEKEIEFIKPKPKEVPVGAEKIEIPEGIEAKGIEPRKITEEEIKTIEEKEKLEAAPDKELLELEKRKSALEEEIKIAPDMDKSRIQKQINGLDVRIRGLKEKVKEEAALPTPEEIERRPVSPEPKLKGKPIEEIKPIEAPEVQVKKKKVGESIHVSKEMNNLENEFETKLNQISKKEKKEKEAGFLRIGAAKEAEPEGAIPKVRETLQAGRAEEEGFSQRIKSTITRQADALKENIFNFKYSLQKSPQFRDDYRTQEQPRRRRMRETIDKWRKVVFHDTYKNEGKTGIQKATDIVIMKDFIQRGKEGQTLPNELTVKEVENHLDWLIKSSSPEVIESANNIQKILKGLGSELVVRGKIEKTREDYFPHQVMDFQPDWMHGGLMILMPRKFRKPYRPYTKQAVGSKRIIATSDDALWTHIAKVMSDNQKEDWMLHQASKYDKLKEWKKTNPKAPVLRKGMVVDIKGKPYKALEYNRVFYKTPTIDEKMLKQAVESDATVQEWLSMQGPRGGKPKREAIAVGKPKMFLVPADIANTLDNLSRGNAMWDLMYSIGAGTQWWKKFTLTTAGATYQLGNLMGDTMNTALFDPASFKYMPSAVRIAQKNFFPSEKITLTDFENKVLKIAREKDVMHSGMFAELRRAYGWRPISETYQKVSEYRESLNRLAILSHQLARVEAGKNVQNVAGIKLEGLDPESAAAKVAREALVDYTSTPDFYKLFLSRGIAPFVRFHEANFRNHLRAATDIKTGAAMKYWTPVVATYAAAWAYNNLDKDRKELEMKLPDYIRDRLHVVLGTDKEGNIKVWAPQQPVDMAASWIGMDSFGRILSDLHGKKISFQKAARQFISEIGNGWREESRSLMNPIIQFWQGLQTNRDPFTRRKVMPDEIFNQFKKDWTHLDAARYWIPFLGEKIFTPIAQFSRTKRATEPTTHPVLDWLVGSPLNVKRGLGFYEFDPKKQDLSEHFDARGEAAAKYELWRERFYQTIDKKGTSEKVVNDFIEKYKESGLTDLSETLNKWAESNRFHIAEINYKLRHTKDPNERRELQEAKRYILEDYKEDSYKAIPKSARDLYFKELLGEEK